MVWESGASWTTRGVNPALSQARTMASRRLEPALAGKLTNGWSARSVRAMRSRAASGWSPGRAQISSSSPMTRVRTPGGGGQADEAEVEAALGNAGERGVGVGLAGEDQLDAGVGGADGAGEQRQRLVAGGPGEADGDPAVLAAPGGLDGADGEVEVVQDGADRAEEGLMRRW